MTQWDLSTGVGVPCSHSAYTAFPYTRRKGKFTFRENKGANGKKGRTQKIDKKTGFDGFGLEKKRNGSREFSTKPKRPRQFHVLSGQGPPHQTSEGGGGKSESERRRERKRGGGKTNHAPITWRAGDCTKAAAFHGGRVPVSLLWPPGAVHRAFLSSSCALCAMFMSSTNWRLQYAAQRVAKRQSLLVCCATRQR
jgi:hypothetical protein